MDTEKRKEGYVVAMDSFKGCLTSPEACAAVAQGLREYRGAEAVEVPVSDGGDGMTEALKGSITGYEERRCQTHDALMRPCDAVYLISGEKVIIEVAQACGISRLKGETLRPLSATSFGVGELLIDAIRAGGRQFYIGLGGTATSDCGLGMLQAFKEGWLRMHGTFDVALRTWTDVNPQLESLGLQVTLLSDVTNPLCGPMGSAYVFGPQKGANEEEVRLLERRAGSFARMSASHFGFDYSQRPGAGAAGGLGYAFMQYFNASVQSGAEAILDLIGFDTRLEGRPAGVFTGEGKSDGQTLMGKLPMIILGHCRKYGVACHLLAGKVEDEDELIKAGFASVKSINPEGIDPKEMLKPETARHNLSLAVKPC